MILLFIKRKEYVLRAEGVFRTVPHRCAAQEVKLELHESAEDYLETILILMERNGQVRSIDIVNEMNFSKPSISIAMKKLREHGFIRMDVNGLITLTQEGREVAERIYSRHKLLTSVLVAIGVDGRKAAEEACKIEHDIDDETYDRIYDFYHSYFEKKKEQQAEDAG